MKKIIPALVLCAAWIVACTSPVDLNTPRSVVAFATHVPLAESLRVKPSVSISVFENDVSSWISTNDYLTVVNLDTTFHPPLQWISGELLANKAAMALAPTSLGFYFHCDTFPSGSTHLLSGEMFKTFVGRHINSVIQYDTLYPDSMISAQFSSGYYPAQKQILDTFRYYFNYGVRGDAVVYGSVIMKIIY